eukprot:c6212_g1_i1.p1 GENE.c6212_g1_i1~~c6212_g1_i1.p1  ORF type:complete len:214 (+),score=54.79 c6212_g1_i1:39-680(+)
MHENDEPEHAVFHQALECLRSELQSRLQQATTHEDERAAISHFKQVVLCLASQIDAIAIAGPNPPTNSSDHYDETSSHGDSEFEHVTSCDHFDALHQGRDWQSGSWTGSWGDSLHWSAIINENPIMAHCATGHSAQAAIPASPHCNSIIMSVEGTVARGCAFTACCTQRDESREAGVPIKYPSQPEELLKSLMTNGRQHINKNNTQPTMHTTR